MAEPMMTKDTASYENLINLIFLKNPQNQKNTFFSLLFQCVSRTSSKVYLNFLYTNVTGLLPEVLGFHGSAGSHLSLGLSLEAGL